MTLALPSVPDAEADRLSVAAAHAVNVSTNEATLRHTLESELKHSSAVLGLEWLPFQLDQALAAGTGQPVRFVDVAHGAVVIEYEAPGSFGGQAGAKLKHAQNQARDYSELLAREEGRDLTEYVLVAWDGTHVSFGRHAGGSASWEPLVPFTAGAAKRLLNHLAEDGIPLVHPLLLNSAAGPSSDLGRALIPSLYDAVVEATSATPSRTRTGLLFMEWRRLFGQVAGVQSDRLREFLESQESLHDRDYAVRGDAYLFALYTYLALVAKAVAALSLPQVSERLTDAAVPVADRIDSLESGQLFTSAGIDNMLNGDFFSWYRGEPWKDVEPHVDALLSRLAGISFDVARKSADSTRDLFKGLYETFVPGAVRHALGEFYTPDWLAEHALDALGWSLDDGLVDPTCGSGTFLLEALKRRLRGRHPGHTAAELLHGLYGLDLNPLAVLCARASLVVFLSDRFSATDPVRLPVFLADAVNPAHPVDGVYRHALQTERGVLTFAVPESLVRREQFPRLLDRARVLIDDGHSRVAVVEALESMVALDEDERGALSALIDSLVDLHEQEWDGLWCSILADRFAAGAIEPSSHVAGNPPWVKWSNLPPEYADFIKDHCQSLGAFSEDRWVGGIESDISTVITLESARSRLAPGGRLAFFITGTVFANESSQGFRRFRIPGTDISMRVVAVEDFDAVKPFPGVANHPTLLLLERDGETKYPVEYVRWEYLDNGGGGRRAPIDSAAAFRRQAHRRVLQAAPVPGTDAGPWLKGSAADHEVWNSLFGPSEPAYRARKGITTDLNGVFFVTLVDDALDGGLATITNHPDLGRKAGIPKTRGTVEAEHLFPLLRGADIRPFDIRASEDDLLVLMPQRGMHGDPTLASTAPHTHRFLSRFNRVLKQRSSYRRFQRGQPYWSLWSTGPYTFADYKVLWREMSGRRFVAGYTGPVTHPALGRRPVVPDHKAYFVPLDTEDEAAYLTAVLNAPTVANAVNGYSAQLSLGASVVEYLDIPKFDPGDPLHRDLSSEAQRLRAGAGTDETGTFPKLDELARRLFGLETG
ncbi:MAG TPA: N-6 DNA methylase [Solirubrobacteraceae bacterium]|nr:N-6 DNA methylase [Solirubrobacteraceae bacterium]